MSALSLRFVLVMVFAIPEIATAAPQGDADSCARAFRALGTGATAVSKVAREGALRIKSAMSAYAREIRAEPMRLLIVPRDTEVKRNAMDYFLEFPVNPVATAFNRPRRLSFWSSAAGYWAFMEGLNATASYSEDKAVEAAYLAKAFVPGGEYTWSLIRSGALTPVEAAAQIQAHQKAWKRWLASGGRLPRGQVLKDETSLTETDLGRLDAIAREVARSDKTERGKIAALKRAIDSDEKLSRYSALERELFSTYLWPLVKVKGQTDLHLGKLVLGAPEDQSVFAAIRSLLEASGDVGLAYALASQAVSDPKALQSKVQAAQMILPAEKWASIQRPDIPAHSREITFDRTGSGKPEKLKGELDRWKLLLSDPRLAEAAGRWKRGEISDVLALRAVEDWMKGLTEMQKLQGAKLDEQTVIQLFGLQDSSTLNPALSEMRITIAQVVKEMKLDDRAAIECFRSGAEVELANHQEEAAWVRQGLTGAEYEKRRDSTTERYLASYREMLEKCANPAKR